MRIFSHCYVFQRTRQISKYDNIYNGKMYHEIFDTEFKHHTYNYRTDTRKTVGKWSKNECGTHFSTQLHTRMNKLNRKNIVANTMKKKSN